MGQEPIPFDHLPSHRNASALSKDFIDKWVIPYYMTLGKYGYDWVDTVRIIEPEITKEITLQLLGDLNWRSRLVGAYFAAVKAFDDQIDIIGTHLLKSETCCVGHVYALTLAFFNKENANQYIDAYLNYYLTKPKLYFDQQIVMSASVYLDKVNSTSHSEKHMDNWQQLMQAWGSNKALTSDYFEENIHILRSFQKI